MKTYFIPHNIKYTGEQLKPLFAYLNYGLLGDSIVSWCGPCEVSWEHMVDVEDLKDQSAICGDQMLHFIIEVFRVDLVAGVSLQRLLACLVKDELELLVAGLKIRRKGDDLYWEEKKLSISIASCSATSVQIHFAINITNEGTPVSTCALSDFSISSLDFAQSILKKFANEYVSIVEATQKVKSL